MAAKKTRVSLKLSDKVDIINRVNNKETIKKVSKEYGVGETTCYRIIRDQEKVLSQLRNGKGSTKRQRPPEFPQLEEALVQWMKETLSKNIPIDGPLIRGKAEQFAKLLKLDKFKPSNGWIEGFKKRNGLSFKQICGEENAVNPETCERWKEQLKTLIEGYEPRNIFNADEAALFFKCVPDKTFTFKGEKCSGGKLSKERITALFCANMDGSEKLPLLIIGKSLNPRCFKGKI